MQKSPQVLHAHTLKSFSANMFQSLAGNPAKLWLISQSLNLQWHAMSWSAWSLGAAFHWEGAGLHRAGQCRRAQMQRGDHTPAHTPEPECSG